MKSHRSLLATAVVLSLLAVASHRSDAANVKAVDAGIEVEAGTLGSFTIEYPQLLGDGGDKPVQALIEKKPAGKKATVKYEGGATVDITIDDAGDIVYRLSGQSDKVKQFKTMAILPYSTLHGGTFGINGGEPAKFPDDKPAKPHLFQGNKQTLDLTAVDGTKLSLGAPKAYSYLQLTDNREWGWQAYGWMTVTPVDPANPIFVITTSGKNPNEVAAAAATGAAAKPAAVKVVKGISVKDQGVHIDVGTAGGFTFEFPKLVGKDGKPGPKLVEQKVSGNKATIKYEGGASIDIEVASAAGEVKYELSNVPGTVASFNSSALVSFNYSTGGTYKINDGEPVAFPPDKPAKPHLYQGNPSKVTITDVEGRAVQFQFPQYAYAEITDNREWNWKTFALKFHTPYNADQSTYVMKITDAGSGEAPKRVILVDKFGQTTRFDFPDKVKSEEELKADVEAEKAYYDSLTPPTFDKYGGLPGSGEALGLQKTGFFHVEKKGERWHLVDPEGNTFFAIGVCGAAPVDDITYIEGRQGIYEWLPKYDSEFKTAFRPNEPSAFSFHLANQIKKYGKPFDLTEYQDRMLMRFRKWGFNTIGPFSGITSAVKDRNFAYVASLPYGPWPGIPDLPGLQRAWDPFEPKNVERVQKFFASELPKRLDDANLIGYYLNNEPIYEDVVRVVPRLDGTKHAAKKRLVQMLEEKYKTIDAFNTAWKAQAASFDALVTPGLAIATPEAAADMAAYHDLFFETYYKLIHDTFKQHDQNHMLIGNRFQSGTINNERLVAICAKYNDIVSYNYYTYGVDTDRLKRIYQWSGGKPMMLTEWFVDSPKDSGLPGGGIDVSSQAERGLAYRNYVETAASLDFIVGQTWFSHVDQSLTGRWFQKYNGENANSGFIAVTDRPWKPLLAHAMETNYTIYDLILGKRKAFAWDDPRFAMNKAGKKQLTIAHSAGTIAMDGTAGGFPGVPAQPISGQRLVQGANANGFEASFKLCYDEDNLYVLIDVSDPTPMLSDVGRESIWSADAVELFIGHEKLDDAGQPLFSDRQILLAASKTPKTWVHNQVEQPEIPVVCVPKVDGKGYVLQAKISSKVLGFKPAEGKEIRFDLGIDDSADGKRRDRQLMWNGTERNSGDRTGWGRASFVK